MRPIPRYVALAVLLAMAGFAAIGFFSIKRDVDNMTKNVMDALSNIAYDDDKQVCRMIVTKRLAREKPSTIVTLRRVHGYLDEH